MIAMVEAFDSILVHLTFCFSFFGGFGWSSTDTTPRFWDTAGFAMEAPSPVPRQRCLDMTSNEATKKLLEKRAALEKRALEKMEKRAAKAAKTQVTCSRLGRSGK